MGPARPQLPAPRARRGQVGPARCGRPRVNPPGQASRDDLASSSFVRASPSTQAIGASRLMEETSFARRQCPVPRRLSSERPLRRSHHPGAVALSRESRTNAPDGGGQTAGLAARSWGWHGEIMADRWGSHGAATVQDRDRAGGRAPGQADLQYRAARLLPGQDRGAQPGPGRGGDARCGPGAPGGGRGRPPSRPRCGGRAAARLAGDGQGLPGDRRPAHHLRGAGTRRLCA